MNDKQITAISREYAEFTDLSPVDKKNISAICENFLKYALRRYCLVEKKAKSMQLSDVKQKIDAWIENHTDEEVYECLKEYGAVEDVDTVIQGWIARDKNGDLVCCAGSRPYKEENIPFWKVNFRNFIECIPNDLYPDLTWDSEPEEVEIIIKRK